MKETTLCLIIDRSRSELLMILKKRGQGEGKWNMPGGKVAPGETVLNAAAREAEEETGIRPLNAREIGLLEFYFHQPADPSKSWDNRCHIFLADQYSGALIHETEECQARWVPLAEIPYDRMWDDDSTWLPRALRGEHFHYVCRFDSSDKMTEMQEVR